MRLMGAAARMMAARHGVDGEQYSRGKMEIY
jgi:hypothetical protein